MTKYLQMKKINGTEQFKFVDGGVVEIIAGMRKYWFNCSKIRKNFGLFGKGKNNNGCQRYPKWVSS